MKYALILGAVLLATPALADEIGVRAGPVGAGVTVGETHRDHDRTIVKEHEPAEHTTIIKKDHDEPRTKTIIKERHDD